GQAGGNVGAAVSSFRSGPACEGLPSYVQPRDGKWVAGGALCYDGRVVAAATAILPRAFFSPYRMSTAVSFFANVELVPGDPILGLTEAYNADSRPTKVNLGVGIYYDESGRIPLLRAVRQIEEQLATEAKPRGYLPIDGLPAYTQATRELVFGADSPLLAAGRVATSQT